MSKPITLDGDVADKICCESIRQHIIFVKKDINKLKKSKSRQHHEKEELGYNMSLLMSLQDVYTYYGGRHE